MAIQRFASRGPLHGSVLLPLTPPLQFPPDELLQQIDMRRAIIKAWNVREIFPACGFELFFTGDRYFFERL